MVGNHRTPGDLPAIVQEYDLDGSGKIEQDEWALAIADYSAQKLTTPQIQVITRYRGLDARPHRNRNFRAAAPARCAAPGSPILRTPRHQHRCSSRCRASR